METSNPKVIFTEKDHSYWWGDGPLDKRKRMDSVTTYFGRFCKPFERDLWLTKNILQEILGNQKFWGIHGTHEPYLQTQAGLELFFKPIIDDPKYFFELRKNILKTEWELANAKGTDLHEEIENSIYDDGYFWDPVTDLRYDVIKYDKLYPNQTICENLADLPDGAYPELLVWDEEAMLAGQADLVCIRTEGSARYTAVHDWKTNGGYKQGAEKKRADLIKCRPGSKPMSPPFQHLNDCTHVKYKGQLSLYQRMLEKAGYTPELQCLHHFINYDRDQCQIIPFDYMQKTADDLINLRIEEQKKPLTIHL